MLDHSCQVRRRTLAERGPDCYSTPLVAVQALLRVEQLPRTVWEPCAGFGNISTTLRDAGHEVIASDLHDYPGTQGGIDFLQQQQAPAGCTCIVTNPPFRIANQFVAHALDLCPIVVMLLRLAFLESERRTNILEGRGLHRIHVFRLRLPMMHRQGWNGRKSNSGMAFCWMRWDRGFQGPAELHRISWER